MKMNMQIDMQIAVVWQFDHISVVGRRVVERRPVQPVREHRVEPGVAGFRVGLAPNVGHHRSAGHRSADRLQTHRTANHATRARHGTLQHAHLQQGYVCCI